MSGTKSLLILLILGSYLTAQSATASSMTSREGFQQIQWQDSFSHFSHLVLSEGTSTFVYPLTSGQHLTISGLPDGHYQIYGKNQVTGTMQKTRLQLTVQHYPLHLAFGLFSLGLIVFIYLLMMLYRFSRLNDLQTAGE